MSIDRLLRDELRLRAFDRRLVGLDRRARRIGLRARLLADVLRDDAALDELRLAFGGELLIFGVRGVARELRFGLREQRLDRAPGWPRPAASAASNGRAIDREERLPFLTKSPS